MLFLLDKAWVRNAGLDQLGVAVAERFDVHPSWIRGMWATLEATGTAVPIYRILTPKGVIGNDEVYSKTKDLYRRFGATLAGIFDGLESTRDEVQENAPKIQLS